MRKLIIITHKTLANGLKDSLEFFTNMGEQIIAIAAYENGENEFPKIELERSLATRNKTDQVFILTDLMGGSVNQASTNYLDEQTFVITGVNLPLALEILLAPKDQLDIIDIENIIERASAQILLMNFYKNDSLEADE